MAGARGGLPAGGGPPGLRLGGRPGLRLRVLPGSGCSDSSFRLSGGPPRWLWPSSSSAHGPRLPCRLARPARRRVRPGAGDRGSVARTGDHQVMGGGPGAGLPPGGGPAGLRLRASPRAPSPALPRYRDLGPFPVHPGTSVFYQLRSAKASAAGPPGARPDSDVRTAPAQVSADSRRTAGRTPGALVGGVQRARGVPRSGARRDALVRMPGTGRHSPGGSGRRCGGWRFRGLWAVRRRGQCPGWDRSSGTCRRRRGRTAGPRPARPVGVDGPSYALAVTWWRTSRRRLR